MLQRVPTLLPGSLQSDFNGIEVATKSSLKIKNYKRRKEKIFLVDLSLFGRETGNPAQQSGILPSGLFEVSHQGDWVKSRSGLLHRLPLLWFVLFLAEIQRVKQRDVVLILRGVVKPQQLKLGGWIVALQDMDQTPKPGYTSKEVPQSKYRVLRDLA